MEIKAVSVLKWNYRKGDHDDLIRCTTREKIYKTRFQGSQVEH